MPEQITPPENGQTIDQEIAEYIFQNSTQVFDHYNRMLEILSRMDRVRARDISIIYRRNFHPNLKLESGRKEVFTVSYLLQKYNDGIKSAEQLRQLAGQSLDRAGIHPEQNPEQNQEQSPANPEIQQINQDTSTRTRQSSAPARNDRSAQADEDMTEWLTDAVNRSN